jgi:hypothetical protein
MKSDRCVDGGDGDEDGDKKAEGELDNFRGQTHRRR